MNFIEIQRDFTRHMRDPLHCSGPRDVEDRRMAIYRDLLYRNVEGFMARSFPVLRKITPDDRWHDMIRDYFRRHRARTPLFPRMPLEFLYYLEHERGGAHDVFPFLYELAHYEWMELELAYDQREISLAGVDQNDNLLDGIPVLNPLCIPLVYVFPVHRIRPDFIPQTAPDNPSYLLIYRNLDDATGFFELNPVTARLVDLLQHNTNCSGRDLLMMIAAELQHPNPEDVVRGGHEVMQRMLEKTILTGTRSAD
jgi:hypothetical protein